MADIHNINSRKVLEKCGLKYVETFEFPLLKAQCDWLKITKVEWQKINSNEHLKTKIKALKDKEHNQ